MGSISTREHIRWPPQPAAEPTSTLVLTSPGRRFVDVRVLKAPGGDSSAASSAGFGVLPLDRLDWAFAGTSAASQRDDGRGGAISHSTFHHWVDSRTRDAEGVRDEGDMHPRPDGTALETGRMVNPATGAEAEYEELWRDEGPGESAPCVVLQLHDDGRGARGLIIRLGGYCQGLMRVGSAFAAERWARSTGGGWTRTVRVGDGRLPCHAAIELADGGSSGDITDGGDAWRIVERTRG